MSHWNDPPHPSNYPPPIPNPYGPTSSPHDPAPTYLSTDPYASRPDLERSPTHHTQSAASLYPDDSASNYPSSSSSVSATQRHHDHAPYDHQGYAQGYAGMPEVDHGRTASENAYQDPYSNSISAYPPAGTASQSHIPLISHDPPRPSDSSELSASTVSLNRGQPGTGSSTLAPNDQRHLNSHDRSSTTIVGPNGEISNDPSGWKHFRDEYPSTDGYGGYDSSGRRYGDPEGVAGQDYAIGDRDRGLEDGEGKETYPPKGRGLGRGIDDDYQRPSWFMRMVRDPTPAERKAEEYRRGIGVQERAWACWILAIGCGVAFIVEIANNWKAQGSPISTKPYFNYMIGPSSYVLINSGARFVPCMKSVPEIENLPFACLNDTSNPPTSTCSLADICGFGLEQNQTPDQSFRFFLPVFLHAGLIHILLNLLALSVSSALIERLMGSIRFLLVFIPSGIFGFVLGGNFALVGLPSVGASGAIFGTHAAILVDLLSHWKLDPAPGRKLVFLLIEIVIGFAIGFIPFAIDNFSHIGGFLMGLLLSIVLLPSIHQTRRHRLIIYVVRIVAAVLVIVLFVVLVRNFYVSDPNQACQWCRYLSCLPSAANNHCKGTGLTMTETTTTTTSNGGSRALMLYGLPNLVYIAVRMAYGRFTVREEGLLEKEKKDQ